MITKEKGQWGCFLGGEDYPKRISSLLFEIMALKSYVAFSLGKPNSKLKGTNKGQKCDEKLNQKQKVS